MQEIKQMAAKALSRIRNMLSRGILNSITPAKTPTASVTLFSQETYEGIEFAQDFGFISSPPVDGGTEVIVAFFGGARDHGTILKAFNKSKALNLPLLPGECAIYNNFTNTYVYLKQDGSILIKSDVSIKIDSPSVTLTGSLVVNGDITDNATGAHINTTKVRDMRTIYDGHHHSGVTIGSGSTSTPTEQM